MSDTFEQLVQLISSVKQESLISRISQEDKLNDYIDSMSMLEFLQCVEDHFRISIRPSDVNPDDFENFRNLSVLIEKLLKQNTV